jgi:transcriptional regulator with XRE-family HTH domain
MAVAVLCARRGAMLEAKPQTQLGRHIQQEMEQRGYDQKAPFARAAGISVTYLDQLLRGYGSSGTEIEPSPRILRQIASALTRGARNVSEVETVYAELMEAAGYMPHVQSEREGERRVSESAERIRRQIEELLEETERNAQRLRELKENLGQA